MKIHVLWFLKLIVTAALVFLFIKFAPGIPISSVVTQKTDLFSVTGEGKVSVVPDVAILSLGMVSSKNTVKQAQVEANTIVNQLIKALKELNIDEKDIKTTNYSVYPDYDYNNGANKIAGFRVNVNLSVTVRDIDNVNDILDRSTSLGANSIGGIQFTVEDKKLKELQNEARKEAIEDAKEKASQLSKLAGMNLGKIVNISENFNNQPRYYAKESVGGSGADVQPGSTDITTSVILFYETR
jgi:uncharacterized protein YggE